MNVLRAVYIVFVRLSKILSRKGIYPFLNREFGEIEPNKKVLTIGAGGEVNELLNKYSTDKSFDVTSFDISENRQPDILGDICTYDFKEDKYDYVVIAEVLEHLHSPHLAVDKIYNILSGNGKVILTVPFIFPIHERPHDYYRFTKYGLRFLFKDFSNLKIKERNSWIEAISVLYVRLIMDKNIVSRLFSPFFIILAFINFPFIIIISKIIKTDFITTGYLLTAEKVNKVPSESSI